MTAPFLFLEEDPGIETIFMMSGDRNHTHDEFVTDACGDELSRL
jgi:hypothetical protein